VSDLTKQLENQAVAEFDQFKRTLERLLHEHDVRGMVATDGRGWPEFFRFERLATNEFVERIRAEKREAARVSKAA
jgi:hypothetical protein